MKADMGSLALECHLIVTSLCRLLGIKTDRVLGRSVAEIWHPFWSDARYTLCIQRIRAIAGSELAEHSKSDIPSQLRMQN